MCSTLFTCYILMFAMFLRGFSCVSLTLETMAAMDLNSSLALYLSLSLMFVRVMRTPEMTVYRHTEHCALFREVVK